MGHWISAKAEAKKTYISSHGTSNKEDQIAVLDQMTISMLLEKALYGGEYSSGLI